MTESNANLGRDLLLYLAAIVAGALLLLLGRSLQAGESPIIIRDGGSIELGSSSPALTQFPSQNANEIRHPNDAGAIREITGVDSAGRSVTVPCGNLRCRLEVRYNDNPNGVDLFIAERNGGRGLLIHSNTPFAAGAPGKSWNRSDPAKWVLGGSTLKIARAEVTAFQAGSPVRTLLCGGPGCSVVVKYAF